VKKILVVLSVLVIAMATAIAVFIMMSSNDLPQGESGEKAEQLTDDMLEALGYEAYQEIKTISWSFPGGHHFVWSKDVDSVEVKWEQYEVYFSTKTLQGEATSDGVTLTGEEQKEALEIAWSYFANDSFWLVAPFKVRDPGTTREYVDFQNGKALLVHYASGGVTPGDSYLWILDDNNRPTAWRMWTQILPIGGLEFTWTGWTNQEGAWFAPLHSGLISVNLENLSVSL